MTRNTPASVVEAAKAAYRDECDNGPIHCNRMPTWDELPESARQKRIAALAQPSDDVRELLREAHGYATLYRADHAMLAKAVSDYQTEAQCCWRGDELVASVDLTHAVNNLSVAVARIVSMSGANVWMDRLATRIDTALSVEQPDNELNWTGTPQSVGGVQIEAQDTDSEPSGLAEAHQLVMRVIYGDRLIDMGATLGVPEVVTFDQAVRATAAALRNREPADSTLDTTYLENAVLGRLGYTGDPDNVDAKEYRNMWTGALKQANRWRGIASAMGYEPKAHDSVKPREKWLMDRIAKYRAEAACDAVLEEREACARVADEAVAECIRWRSPSRWMAAGIAQAIRDRGEA